VPQLRVYFAQDLLRKLGFCCQNLCCTKTTTRENLCERVTVHAFNDTASGSTLCCKENIGYPNLQGNVSQRRVAYPAALGECACTFPNACFPFGRN